MGLKVAYHVLSEPADVYWSGFRSDTRTLQQAGWEIAAEEEVMYDRLRLLLRNRDLKLYALTDYAGYEYRARPWREYSIYHARGSRPPLLFQVVMCAPRIEIHRHAAMGATSFDNFRQIDAEPQFLHDVEIKSIDDFKIFATPLARTEEIIVDPMTVSEMLDQIRKMQVPEQERIRQKERLAASRAAMNPEVAPRQVFHAQVISINDQNWRKVA